MLREGAKGIELANRSHLDRMAGCRWSRALSLLWIQRWTCRRGERRRVTDPRGWLRAQLTSGPPTLPAPPEATPDAIADARSAPRGNATIKTAAESRAALTEPVTTQRAFLERLVAFWSNHLCVVIGAKILVAPLAGSHEREAIRPHVLGRFANMALASATRPAMLAHLDNLQSIGPNSRRARAGTPRT